MKFLSSNMEGKDLLLMNAVYEPGTQWEFSTPDDYLDLVIKDTATGQRFVVTIDAPKIDVYVTKPEYRDHQHIKDFEMRKKCDLYTISYKNRFGELGKILNESPKNVKFSPYIYQADMDICHFYKQEFYKYYLSKGSDRRLNKAFLDIENDIIRMPAGVFPEPGECPMNCVSVMDDTTKQMYTLVLTKHNLPSVDKDHRKYAYYKNLEEKFEAGVTNFLDNIDRFKAELSGLFDETYGKITYNVLTFDDEKTMHSALWTILHSIDIDFLEIWNAPYDVSNLVERLPEVGLYKDEVIPHKSFGERKVWYKEDRNVNAHKRKHQFILYNTFTAVDQMVHYAGIRAPRGKLPSVKLNAIARNELKDEKLDYSESGNIKFFPYLDFWNFVVYNIKDVLLQIGIERKTRDMDAIFNTTETANVSIHEVFTSTAVVANSLRLYADTQKERVMGSNKNKLYKKTIEAANELLADDKQSFGSFRNKIHTSIDDDMEEEPDIAAGGEIDDSLLEVEEEAASDKPTAKKKEDKFAGAIVMSPSHATPSGTIIMGKESSSVHDNVIDFDITSEYPTAILIMNACNDTFFCKIEMSLEEAAKIPLPLYENMYFVDSKDELGYAKTGVTSNLLMEFMSEGDILTLGKLALNLPGTIAILDVFEEYLENKGNGTSVA